MNHCWLIIDWIRRSKLQWNSNPNTTVFIKQNEVENIVCKWQAFCHCRNLLIDACYRDAGLAHTWKQLFIAWCPNGAMKPDIYIVTLICYYGYCRVVHCENIGPDILLIENLGLHYQQRYASIPFSVWRRYFFQHKILWNVLSQGCRVSTVVTQIAKFMGQHGAQLGPVGPRWAHVGPMSLAIRAWAYFCMLQSNMIQFQ